MRVGILAVLASLIAGCAAAPPVRVGEDPLAGFLREVRKGDPQAAARFWLAVDSKQKADPAYLAQYELLAGHPRAASEAIDHIGDGRIDDEHRRTLFRAVLAALVSVERPLREERVGTRGPVEIYPVESGEVWQDEWNELHFPGLGRMPLVAEAKRASSRARAKALFESLPETDFYIDFNLVALAMDVGVTLPHPERLVVRYRNEAANPYYQRLSSIPPGAIALKGSQSDGQIELTELKLQKTEVTPHPVRVPRLVEREGE